MKILQPNRDTTRREQTRPGFSLSNTGVNNGDAPCNTARHDRGVAYQLDFLTGILILAGAFSILSLVGVAFLQDTASESIDERVQASADADRLIDELLVNEVNSVTLSRDCTSGFFNQDATSGCNHNPAWEGSTFLQEALVTDATNIYIEIIDTETNSVVTVNGVSLTVGEKPNSGTQTTVVHRYVSLEADSDSNPQLYSLRVIEW